MFARRRRRRRLLALALVALVSCAAGIAAAIVSKEPGDVTNPEVEFQAEEAPEAPPAERTGQPHADFFAWPTYGLTTQRTRFLPLKRSLRPPYTFVWAVRGSVLLEFPPTAGRRQLFLLKNNGALYAISRRTGQVRWKRKLGYLAVASPAYANGTVYATILERFRGKKAGRVVAVDAATGRTRWSRKLASRSESSPVVSRGKLYFDAEDGSV